SVSATVVPLTTACLPSRGTASLAGRFILSLRGDYRAVARRPASPILQRHRPLDLKSRSLPPRPAERNRTVSAGTLGMAQLEQAPPQLTPIPRRVHTPWSLRSRTVAPLNKPPHHNRL